MSTEETRTRILDAARRRLEGEGWPTLGMGEIADAAGVSRQAVYLHFGSRAALLLALVERIDRTEGVHALAAEVLDAPTGEEALARLVRMNAIVEPRIRSAVAAHDVARHSDPELERAWRDRMRSRRRLYRRVVSMLRAGGSLAPGVSPGDAVDLMWSLLGSRVHDDLVAVRGWPRERYEWWMHRLLERALLRSGR